jgi:hypothetical protein
MAYDFSVAWQFPQREQLVFCYGSNATPILGYLYNVQKGPMKTIPQKEQSGHPARGLPNSESYACLFSKSSS